MMSFVVLLLLFQTDSFADEFDTVAMQVEKRNSPMQVTGKIVPQEGSLRVQSARSSGRILSILKKEGDFIKSGDPLFEINSAECSSLREEKKIASERGLSELLSSTEERQRELSLKVNEGDCQFLASSTGILMKRNVESGTAFSTGDSLASILDPNKLTVELDVPEKGLNLIKIGQKVKFSLSSQSNNRSYVTKIEKIVPAIDPQSRTSKVRLAPVPFHSQFTLEMLVFAEIGVIKQESVFLVPNSALGFYKGKQYILILSQGQPKPFQVEVLEEFENTSQIRPITSLSVHQNEKVIVRRVPFILNSLFKGASPS